MFTFYHWVTFLGRICSWNWNSIKGIWRIWDSIFQPEWYKSDFRRRKFSAIEVVRKSVNWMENCKLNVKEMEEEELSANLQIKCFPSPLSPLWKCHRVSRRREKTCECCFARGRARRFRIWGQHWMETLIWGHCRQYLSGQVRVPRTTKNDQIWNLVVEKSSDCCGNKHGDTFLKGCTICTRNVSISRIVGVGGEKDEREAY